MGTLRRRRGILVVSLSVIGLVGIGWLWKWSYADDGGGSVERVEADNRIVIVCYRGTLSACRWDGSFAAPNPGRPGIWDAPSEAFNRWLYRPGLTYYPFQSAPSRLLERIGFSAGDQWVTPSPNTVPMHDWMDPKWAGRERWLAVPIWTVALLPALHWPWHFDG